MSDRFILFGIFWFLLLLFLCYYFCIMNNFFVRIDKIFYVDKKKFGYDLYYLKFYWNNNNIDCVVFLMDCGRFFIILDSYFGVFVDLY